MTEQSDADGPRWEHRLDVLLTDGVHGFRCPLCGADVEATLDDLASYDRVKGHLLTHNPTLLANALVEARSWARHGYEIGQESCSWTADSDEPTWMTEQYHAPCAACGWRNGAHADGCAAVGPDEFVIEDDSRTMRPVRADDYGPPVDAAAPAPSYDLEDGDGERYTWNQSRGMWQHDEINGSHYERWQIESDYPPVREVPPVGRYVSRLDGPTS